MAKNFRRRATVAAVVVAGVSMVGLVVLHSEASHVFDGLKSRALALVIASALCGVAAVFLQRDLLPDDGVEDAVDRAAYRLSS